jgi:hypothetical protein
MLLAIERSEARAFRDIANAVIALYTYKRPVPGQCSRVPERPKSGCTGSFTKGCAMTTPVDNNAESDWTPVEIKPDEVPEWARPNEWAKTGEIIKTATEMYRKLDKLLDLEVRDCLLHGH